MSSIPSSGLAGPTSGTVETNDVLRGLNLEQFLQLFITELQNQDPLDPMDNTEILTQISQIREIGATMQLSETLEAVLLGQNLSSATSLIGKQITAIDTEGQEVTGVVDRVTVSGGIAKLHIGNQTIEMNNVREILGAVQNL